LRLPPVLAPLRHRDFRLLWTGQTVSSFGNAVKSVALPFQLLSLGATPVQLGIAIALGTVTSVAFLLVGGVFADRLRRRTLILASDAVGGCVVAIIAVLSATAQLRVEHLYAAAVGLGAAEAFLAPAYNAIIADLVPADVLRASNATRLLGRSVAKIAGPTTGGLIVALHGPASAFALDALTFLFSLATLLLAHPARRAATPSAPILREIHAGFSYVRSVPWLWTTTLYFMLVNVAYAGAGVMTPLLVRDSLGGDAQLYGLISGAVGVGTIVASVAVAQLVIRRPGVVLFAFEMLAACATVGIGLLPVVPAVLLFLAITAAALASSTVIWQGLLQRHVPEHMLGRVSSIDLLGNSVINPVAPLVAAALISAVGPPGTFLVAGVYAVVLASAGLLLSPLRRFEEG